MAPVEANVTDLIGSTMPCRWVLIDEIARPTVVVASPD
jgi:hypothetical protein